MKTYLEFYYSCMKTGMLPDEPEGGLCAHFMGDDLFDLFRPYECPASCMYYWGFAGEGEESADKIRSAKESEKRAFSFTEFRQTIVLFLAAMAGEL